MINVCNRQLDVLLSESRSYFEVKSFSFLPKVGFQPVRGISHRFQGLYLWGIKVFFVLIIIQKHLNYRLIRKAPLIALPESLIVRELWGHESIDYKLIDKREATLTNTENVSDVLLDFFLVPQNLATKHPHLSQSVPW